MASAVIRRSQRKGEFHWVCGLRRKYLVRPPIEEYRANWLHMPGIGFANGPKRLSRNARQPHGHLTGHRVVLRQQTQSGSSHGLGTKRPFMLYGQRMPTEGLRRENSIKQRVSSG